LGVGIWAALASAAWLFGKLKFHIGSQGWDVEMT
jgi:hypothetical protein